MGGCRGLQLRDRGNNLCLSCQDYVGPSYETEFQSGCVMYPRFAAFVRRAFGGYLQPTNRCQNHHSHGPSAPLLEAVVFGLKSDLQRREPHDYHPDSTALHSHGRYISLYETFPCSVWQGIMACIAPGANGGDLFSPITADAWQQRICASFHW